MKQETRIKKIKELEEQIKGLDNPKMIKINISGIIKTKVTQIIETPINRDLEINDYLFRNDKLKKEFIENIKKQFPKDSIIEVKEVKN